MRHYNSYEDMYDTAVNVERAMKERSEFYNKQHEVKRGWISEGIITPRIRTKGQGTIPPTTSTLLTDNTLVLDL